MKLYLSFQSGSPGGQRYEFSAEVTIGRTADNVLAVENPTVSSHHCRIYFMGRHVFVEDLNSTNGTRVNDVLVRAAELRTGDIVTAGHQGQPLN